MAEAVRDRAAGAEAEAGKPNGLAREVLNGPVRDHDRAARVDVQEMRVGVGRRRPEDDVGLADVDASARRELTYLFGGGRPAGQQGKAVGGGAALGSGVDEHRQAGRGGEFHLFEVQLEVADDWVVHLLEPGAVEAHVQHLVSDLPNDTLRIEAGGLHPGWALDVGCGLGREGQVAAGDMMTADLGPGPTTSRRRGYPGLAEVLLRRLTYRPRA